MDKSTQAHYAIYGNGINGVKFDFRQVGPLVEIRSMSDGSLFSSLFAPEWGAEIHQGVKTVVTFIPDVKEMHKEFSIKTRKYNAVRKLVKNMKLARSLFDSIDFKETIEEVLFNGVPARLAITNENIRLENASGSLYYPTYPRTRILSEDIDKCLVSGYNGQNKVFTVQCKSPEQAIHIVIMGSKKTEPPAVSTEVPIERPPVEPIKTVTTEVVKVTVETQKKKKPGVKLSRDERLKKLIRKLEESPEIEERDEYQDELKKFRNNNPHPEVVKVEPRPSPVPYPFRDNDSIIQKYSNVVTLNLLDQDWTVENVVQGMRCVKPRQLPYFMAGILLQGTRRSIKKSISSIRTRCQEVDNAIQRNDLSKDMDYVVLMHDLLRERGLGVFFSKLSRTERFFDNYYPDAIIRIPELLVKVGEFAPKYNEYRVPRGKIMFIDVFRPHIRMAQMYTEMQSVRNWRVNKFSGELAEDIVATTTKLFTNGLNLGITEDKIVELLVPGSMLMKLSDVVHSGIISKEIGGWFTILKNNKRIYSPKSLMMDYEETEQCRNILISISRTVNN